MDRLSVNQIVYIPEDDNGDRRVDVVLSNGTIVHITACCESWEQWGGTNEELKITMPIAEKCNSWLHDTK